ACFDEAMERLRSSGAHLRPVAVPEAREREALFTRLLPTEWLAFFGRERFIAHQQDMDPVVQARVNAGLGIAADEYLRYEWRRVELVALMRERMRGVDAWITPTGGVAPGLVAAQHTVRQRGGGKKH